MAKKRRYRKSKKTIRLNKNSLWIILIILWWLYIFSFFLANWSPIFELLQKYASVPFWEMGLMVFFVLCIIVWILILAKWYLMVTLLKQSLILLMLISAVLNFPILDWDSVVYQDFWWYISWPLIRLLQLMFWNQSTAIKAFVIILLIWCVIWILYTFNFSLPKINLQREKAPAPKQQKVEHKVERQTTQDIVEKLWSNTNVISPKDSGSIIKDMFKRQINEKIKEKEVKTRPTIHFSWDKPTFSTDLLKPWDTHSSINEKFLVEKAKSLQDKLMEFNVPVTIEWFDLWPSVVQIRIKPEAWVAISKIESLTNDIKLSLKSKSLRIVAPIPGTDAVWIQIPNPDPKMVRLQDILASNEFQKWMTKDDTNLTLWKWIDWSVIVKCLDDMPHLLVAWATWSWKSVWVNWFILSLMYQNTPSELKFLMVDPKQVELELYSGLPYMLGPIVSDPDKALKLLRRAVDEMERRYTLLKEKRVRNLTEYNQKIIGEKMYRIVFVIDRKSVV